MSDDSPWAREYYALTDAEGNVIEGEVWPTPDDALDRRAVLMSEHEDGDDVTVEEREDVPCYCQGAGEDWEKHHPTGCGQGGQGWSWVTSGDISDARDEPYVPESGGAA